MYFCSITPDCNIKLKLAGEAAGQKQERGTRNKYPYYASHLSLKVLKKKERKKDYP